MYKFALYGRSDSGKTCLMATLAMGAEGHPRGLTVERIPVAETTDHQSQEGNRDLQALRAGRDWIDAAIGQLRKGSVPEGNPPLFDGSGMITEFNVGSPRRGPFVVRTVDYSGELIKPDEEDRMENAASLLRDFLGEYDGFLILAETPRADAVSPERLSDDLRRLREAFVSLRRSGSYVDAPVAVVLTKWDRQSTIAHEQPDDEIEKLREFLHSHPSHASLVQSISNALTDAAQADAEESELNVFADSGQWRATESTLDHVATSDTPTSGDAAVFGGLQHGNCAVFPSSAFGRSEQVGAMERPQGTQLYPFGLLEPLVWLADQRDAIDVGDIVRKYHQLPSWMYWLKHSRLSDLTSRAGKLSTRVARTSDSGRQLARLLSHLTWKWRRQVSAYVLSPIVLCGIVWMLLCHHEFEANVSVAANPQSSEAHLLAVRDWFDQYRVKPWPVWGPDSPIAAKRIVDQIDERIEQLYWAAIVQTENAEQKVQAARRYLERLKNGRHVESAQQIVADFETSINQRENTEWLASRQAQAARAGEVESELKLAADEIASGFPQPDVSTPEQRTGWMRLREEIGQRLAQVMKRRQWDDFLVSYDSQVSSFQFRLAAQLLVNWEHHDDAWRASIHEFPERTLQRVRQEVDRRLRDANFDSAGELVLEVNDSYRLLEGSLRKTETEAADRMHQAQLELKPLKNHIDERHDHDLYERVRRLKNSTVCQRYLDGAPKGIMCREVGAYDKWLTASSQPLTVTVSVHIFWSKKYGTFSFSTEDDHQLSITVDDVPALLKNSLTGQPGKLSGEVGPFILKGRRLDDTVKLHAALIEIDPVSNDDVGSGQLSIKLRELLSEKSLVIAPADGSAFDNEVRFRIASGVPVEPELPPWKNPSSSR
jgi:hypothetical protein